MHDGSSERVEASHHLFLEPRTRGLLRAAALLLRSVSAEDRETDILLHDMARQIEALLDDATTVAGRRTGPDGWAATVGPAPRS